MDGGVDARVDSSAHAAMTRWMFVVMRVESWRSCCTSARVWAGREVDIFGTGEMLLRCSETSDKLRLKFLSEVEWPVLLWVTLGRVLEGEDVFFFVLFCFFFLYLGSSLPDLSTSTCLCSSGQSRGGFKGTGVGTYAG